MQNLTNIGGMGADHPRPRALVFRVVGPAATIPILSRRTSPKMTCDIPHPPPFALK